MPLEGNETEPTDLAETESYFQLTSLAANGHYSPKTLKFSGLLDSIKVTILIDTGSTHNILQPRIAQHLKLPAKPIPNFSVMVGNGTHLQCSGLCPYVSITLENQLLVIPFYFVPIKGEDVMLGMEWLRTLGPLSADFSIPKLSFIHNQQPITLTGNSTNNPTPSTYTQFFHLIQTNSVASIHLLMFQPNPTELPNPLHKMTSFNLSQIPSHQKSMMSLQFFPKFSTHHMAYHPRDIMITKFHSNQKPHLSTLNPTATPTPKKKP